MVSGGSSGGPSARGPGRWLARGQLRGLGDNWSGKV
jgi:hypothetical protein